MQVRVALKCGHCIIMTLNELKQHFQLSKESTFSFSSLVFGYDLNLQTSQCPLGSSSVLLVQLELIMTLPTRMCLMFRAWTLLHTQPIKSLSHLEPGLPVLLFLTVSHLRPRLGSLGFRFYKENQNSRSHMMFDKNWLSWKLLFRCLSDACPQFPEIVCLCVCWVEEGGWCIDFKPQLNKNAFIQCTPSPRTFYLICEKYDLNPL